MSTAASPHNEPLAAAAPRALAMLGIEPASTVGIGALGRGIHVPTWLSAEAPTSIEPSARQCAQNS